MKSRSIFFYLLLLLVVVTGLFADAINSVLQLGSGAESVIAIALLVYAVISWCFQLAAMSVVSLSLILLVPALGLMEFSEAVVSSFGDSTFVFFLGVLLLGNAFQKTALGKRIAVVIFGLFGNRPKQVLFGLMLAGMLLAMWVTEVAAAAIIFPLATAILEEAKARPDYDKLSKILMIGVAWGPAFGGVATPIATGSNLVAVTYMEQYAAVSISFGHWMAIGVPISLSLLIAGWLILSRELKDQSPLVIDSTLPPFGLKEGFLLADFIVAIFLWVLGSVIDIPSHMVALFAGLVLFLPGVSVLDWKSSVKDINWDSIILICSGLLLGDVFFSTGVAEGLANILFIPALLRADVFVRVFYIVLTVSVLKIMFSSNTVAGILLVPIMITLGASLDIAAWNLVAPCIFSSALAFIVVTSSPVNVIPFSSGAFTPGDLARRGVVMTIASAVIIAAWLSVFSLLGM